MRVANAITGLRTRTGTDRSYRVRNCAQAIACVRDDPQATVAWRHQWCRDRACPACQRVRSRIVSCEIRRVVDARDAQDASLWFVTLTQPRIAGDCLRQSWDRYDRAWVELRDWMHEDAPGVIGGLRATELAWKAGKGWHVHAHTIVEIADDGERVPCHACAGTRVVRAPGFRGEFRNVRCRSCSSKYYDGDGYVPRDLAALVQRWADLTGGSVLAQCIVPCSIPNAGQLAKYIAAPLGDSAAPSVWRELYEVASGRRMHAAWGSWYRKVQLHRREEGRRRWYPIGAVDALREHPRAMVQWSAHANVRYSETVRDAYRVKLHLARGRAPWRIDTGKVWRPEIALGRIRASEVLRRLAEDPRRADEHDPLPDSVPRPFASVIRCLSGPQGPWALKRSGSVPRFYSDRCDDAPRTIVDWSARDGTHGDDGHGGTWDSGAAQLHAPRDIPPRGDADSGDDGRRDGADPVERHSLGVDVDGRRDSE